MEMFKLFGLISTKELYLLKLDVVAKFQYTSYFNGNYTLAFNPRYVLAKRTNSISYKDVFNKTTYDSFECMIGQETIVEARHVVTDKKYITSNEAKKLIKKYNK